MSTDLDERLQALEEACRKAGAKVTHQRREVLRALVSADAHPDAHAVFKAVRERVPTISFDTVYRTLAFLEAHDLIRRVHVSGERARFDGNHRPHHHFVCTRCGQILDFESRALDALSLPGEATALGTPMLTQLQVFGICTSCEATERSQHEQET
jgi:Fur family peroxide stress response transcriptional regulator